MCNFAEPLSSNILFSEKIKPLKIYIFNKLNIYAYLWKTITGWLCTTIVRKIKNAIKIIIIIIIIIFINFIVEEMYFWKYWK